MDQTIFQSISHSIDQLGKCAKLFANLDEIDDKNVNLRILGICGGEFILIYDGVMSKDDGELVLLKLNDSNFNFVYITGHLDLI